MSHSERPPDGVIEIRVRYRDTDCGGVVYHSNHIDYFEWGRTELLRARGTSYRAMEDAGLKLVVTEVSARYQAAAHYDDLLRVETWVEEVGFVRVSFCYRIVRPRDGVVICTGATALGCLQQESGRPVALPNEVRVRLATRSAPE